LEALPCHRCGRLYVEGRNGLCSACRQRKTLHRPRRLRCDCGAPAVTVLLVPVGEAGEYTVRLALCAACLEQERRLRASLAERGLGAASSLERPPGHPPSQRKGE
jgi:hypothetical protein